MSLIPHTIKMIELTQLDFILGSEAGNQILSLLRTDICVGSHVKVIEISFENMRGVDACFIRNSVAAFAKLNCCEIGLYVSNIENIDVLDNLVYGFKAKNMPLIIKGTNNSGAVYADLSSGAHDLLAYAYAQNGTTSQQVAKFFNCSVANASMNLKKLFKLGYLRAEKRTSESGGLEFRYKPFFVSNQLALGVSELKS